jgi:capsular exopolysaccharide synthesis family protein
VLLVDGDLRKPSLHTRLGLNAREGFSNFLAGGASLNSLVQATEQPGLWAIVSGPLPPSPAELLAGERLRTFIDEAESEFDVVLFDGPPIMGFADAPMIAVAVSGALLVVEAGRTGRGQIGLALKRLRMAHARVLGVILAKYDARKSTYGYGYGAGYGYYAYEYGSSNKPKLTEKN